MTDAATTSADPAIELPAGMQVFERGWLSANNILFIAGEQSVLIDSGYCTHADQTLSLVSKSLGRRPLDLLVNTHLHSDHCGGNATLQTAYPEMRTLIPPGHAAEVERWDATALTYLSTGQQCPKFHHEGTLVPGDIAHWGGLQWQIHAAGGHDPHAVLFFEPERKILVSGDALWENGFGVIFPELEGEQAFAEAEQTLQLIATLKPLVVIPGHGRVFRYSAEVLHRATQRLNHFVEHPAKHSRHAVKVLLKFKLLEVQQQPIGEFLTWAEGTAYFRLIWCQLEIQISLRDWLMAMLDELVASHAAHKDARVVFNA